MCVGSVVHAIVIAIDLVLFLAEEPVSQKKHPKTSLCTKKIMQISFSHSFQLLILSCWMDWHNIILTPLKIIINLFKLLKSFFFNLHALMFS